MRPALYYPWVYLKGGAERVILELMSRSRHQWTLYTNHFNPEATYPELAQVEIVQLSRISVRRTISDVARAGLTLLSQRPAFREHDALMVVSEGLGNLVAARSPLPTSCICLTPLKVLYDPHTRERFFGGRLRPSYRTAFALYELLDRPSWRSYERVFTNSDEVRRRLLASRLVDDGRIEVAYHGVDLDRFRPQGPRERFFLVPGRIMWQKNIELAIEAFICYKPRASDSDFRLVIAGMVDAKSQTYLSDLRARAAGRSDIEFRVGPPDDELLRLYQRAWAVIFAAGNEDWGLVPLEAMACARPVIATNRGGPRESVIDGLTGFLCPDRPRDFAQAMTALATMPSRELDLIGSRARARALQFPWSRFVARMDRHVEELAALKGASRSRLAVAARK